MYHCYPFKLIAHIYSLVTVVNSSFHHFSLSRFSDLQLVLLPGFLFFERLCKPVKCLDSMEAMNVVA